MADERRYREEEVSEIFALAAREERAGEERAGEESARPPALADQKGLTLEELQEVGREVGLTPERVARAAATLDTRSETLPRRTLLGAPVSAGRVVDLPREMTDREWQFLIAELRETFGAKGRVASESGVREWSNGNLHAVLEQTAEGHRLRLGTRKGNATEVLTIGIAGLFMALIMLIAMVSKGKTGVELLFPAVFALMGSGALMSNLLRLPRWADERERQMERIAESARDLLGAHPVENDSET